MLPSDHPIHWTCWVSTWPTAMRVPVVTVWPIREKAFCSWSRRMHKRWKSCPIVPLDHGVYAWVWLLRNVWRCYHATSVKYMAIWRAAVKWLAMGSAPI